MAWCRLWRVVTVIVASILAMWNPSCCVFAETATDGTSPSTQAVDLDLSSTAARISASTAGNFASAQIRVGRTTRTVDPSSVLTPAEFVALQQVLASGAQNLNISARGRAISGTFSTSELSGQIANLVIPKGITAVHDAGTLESLKLSGNLSNGGRLFAVSSDPAVTAASFNAANIFNGRHGVLSSILPTSGLSGATDRVANLNLNLTAVQDIVNAGVIKSAGDLTMSAGGSIINALPVGASGRGPVIHAMNTVNLNTANLVNYGVVETIAGNINIASKLTQSAASQVAQNINIAGAGGLFEAIRGTINVRDALYSGKADICMTGGSFVSKELNLFSGAGRVEASVNEITGLVNAEAGEAHALVSSGHLRLGHLTLTGDPTFFNSAVNGDIDIAGDVTVGESLTLIASRDITASADATLTANDGSKGFDITLIAGANMISSATGSSATIGPFPGTGSPADAGVTVTGPSGTGGSILLSTHVVNVLSRAAAGDNPGGNVSLIAYAQPCGGCSQGVTGQKGQVLLSTASIIDSSGSGAGANGGVSIIAGAHNHGISINPGMIKTNGGTGGGGSILMVTSQPVLSNGNVTFGTDGSITSGNGFTFNTTPNAGSIFIDSDIASAGSVTLTGLHGVTIDSAAITVDGGSPIAIQTPDLIFANGTKAASIVATGPSDIRIEGISILGSNIAVTLPSNDTTVISTQGGENISIAPLFLGTAVFRSSGSGMAHLHVLGAPFELSAEDTLTINQDVEIFADHPILVSVSGFGFISPTFTHDGILSTSASGDGVATITVNSGVFLTGNGTFLQSGTIPGDTTLKGSSISFLHGADLKFVSEQPGSRTLLDTPMVRVVTFGLAKDLTATLTTTNNEDIILMGQTVGVIGSRPQIHFETSPIVDSATLNLNGAPVSTNQLHELSVAADFILKSDHSMMLNTAPSVFFGPASAPKLTVNGRIETTGGDSGVLVSFTGDLTVSGGGAIATSLGNLINFRSTGSVGQLRFSTAPELNLIGDVSIDCCAGEVMVDIGATVNYSAGLEIDACTVFNITGFVGPTAPVMNVCESCSDGVGFGTIVNSGDVLLSKGLIVNSNGRDVAIIASGNIRSKGVTSINLSSSTGNSGNLVIIAGTQIAPEVLQQVTDTTSTFVLSDGSSTGGSVQLADVSINARSTADGGIGGNVTIAAFGGSSSPGTVSLGSVSTSSTGGSAGNVLIIGEGGVEIRGSITSTGALKGGDVGLFGAQPEITGAYGINNGTAFGEIRPACAGCGWFSTVKMAGSIVTSSSGAGGRVSITADRLISIGGSITTGGRVSSGMVTVETNGGAFILNHDLNTSGLKGNPRAEPISGSAAGSVNFARTAFVEIGSDLLMRGADGLGFGFGGAGGSFYMVGPNATSNGYVVGSLVIKGAVDLSGGSSDKSVGGDGGTFEAAAGRIVVGGVRSGVSINASGGSGLGGLAPAGLVSLETYSIQPLPTTFDLASEDETEIALPGGMFWVGESKPANGTRGSIVVNFSLASPETVGNGGRILEGVFSTNRITVAVTGGERDVDMGDGSVTIRPNVGEDRARVTPGVALALYQLSRSSAPSSQTIGLNARGQVTDGSPDGGFSRVDINTVDLNAAEPFSSFRLVTADLANLNLVTLNMLGPGPTLNLSAAQTISIEGTVNFIDSAMVGAIDFGSRHLKVTSTGSIVVSAAGSLSFTGTAKQLTNLGAIVADMIEIQHPKGSFSLEMGTEGTIGALSPDDSRATLSIVAPTIKVLGGRLSNVRVDAATPEGKGSLLVSTTYDSEAGIGNVTAHAVKLASTFGSGGPLRIADAARVSGESVTITSDGQLIVGDGAELTSSGKLTAAAQSDILIGSSVTIESTSDMSVTASTGAIVSQGLTHVFAREGDLTITADRIELGVANQLGSGQPADGVYFRGVLVQTDIASYGKLTLEAGSQGMSFGNSTWLTSVGRDLTIKSDGNIAFGNQHFVWAHGGSVRVLASGTIIGGTHNEFVANALQSHGGGIEIGSGLTKSNNLNIAFSLPAGTAPPPASLGSNVIINNGSGTLGVIRLLIADSGVVDLSSSGTRTSTINVNRGAVVLDAIGSGSSVDFDGATFTTNALRPIAYRASMSPSSQDELVDAGVWTNCDGFIHAAEDLELKSRYGQIHIRKGGLAVVQSDEHTLTVFVCSGPGHVDVSVGQRTLHLAPGTELLLSDHPLSEEEVGRPDGVGRRLSRNYHITGSAFATVSEFSLVSLLRYSAYLDSLHKVAASEQRAIIARMTKTAAILHHLGGWKGRYHARMPMQHEHQAHCTSALRAN